MGKGGGNIEVKIRNNDSDPSDAETEPPDGESSPSTSPGSKFRGQDHEELQYLQNTMPVDDIIQLGDGFEDHAMHLGDETQVVDLGGETQVLEDQAFAVDISTQVLDWCDTEVALDSEDEENSRTEVLCDTQELSDDDSSRGGTSTVNYKNVLNRSLSQPGDSKVHSVCPSYGDHLSGSPPGGFSPVHATSTRASGMAALNMTSKRTNSMSRVIKSDHLSQGQQSTGAEKKDKTLLRELGKLSEEYDGQKKALRNENCFKVASSTARKLFTEETLHEIKGPDNCANDAEFAADARLAGLSYIDSQEPGEASQANALDFVDKFLKLNADDYGQELDNRRSSAKASKPVFVAKGTRSLAKRAIKFADGKSGTFEWDDSREDEGGGEFFQKKKELFFGNEGKKHKSFTQNQKPRCVSSENQAVDSPKAKKVHLDTNKKRKDIFCPDSSSMSHARRESCKTSQLIKSQSEKDAMKDLDEQLNAADIAGGNCISDDVLDLNVGPDTQMAAEAMETLRFGVADAGCNSNGANQGVKSAKGCKSGTNHKKRQRESLQQKKVSSSNGVLTRQSNKTKQMGSKLEELPLLRTKDSKRVKRKFGEEPVKAEPKRTRSDWKKVLSSSDAHKSASCSDTARPVVISVKRSHLQRQLDSCTPIAHRTRKCSETKRLKNARTDASGYSRKTDNTGISSSSIKDRSANGQPGKVRNVKSMRGNQLDFDGELLDEDLITIHPKGKRTRQSLPSVRQEANVEPNARSKRSKAEAIKSIDTTKKQNGNQSVCAGQGFPPTDVESRQKPLQQSKGKEVDSTAYTSAVDININVIRGKRSKHSTRKSDTGMNKSDDDAELENGVVESPQNRCNHESACTTPSNCKTPINDASPVCMGDEYHKQSSRKSLSRSYLLREINSLRTPDLQASSVKKDSRRRREMSDVRVLFSHHLDVDIMKQQKKILSRLGASIASSMSDATHFITNKFVRTRNMLEAIALGKPVVTHLWIESCGQVNCFIDEKNFILRDSKKEKEFGFTMPVSLLRACQHPLLQGQRVLITPNTKPSKEILASLVRAVNGLPLERLGRSALKDEKFPDDLLVLSCEDDYQLCVPLLEKGASVYSSELLLNGIVIQKMEYERHQLFIDHVKKTRSTIWLKKDNQQFLPVSRRK